MSIAYKPSCGTVAVRWRRGRESLAIGSGNGRVRRVVPCLLPTNSPRLNYLRA
jgi:hypothetical protein